MKYQMETENMADYLASTAVMDWQNNLAIANKAAELCVDCESDAEKVKALFEYVRDGIPHSGDINGHEIAHNASECITNGHAVCYVKSMLLAAMLRSQGIPTGLCYQRLARANDYILHGLNAVYLKARDMWVRVDARGNLPGKEAEFDVNRPDAEKLVFTVRPEMDEVDYDMIYANPPACITDCLYVYEDAQNLLKQGLPAAL